MKVVILYGTETGNAEMLAEDIARHVGSQATLVPMAGAAPAVFAQQALFVLVSSTYGEGELPSGARAFHAAVTAAAPDLSQLRFAVFSLGDRGTYPETFAFGGKVWDETLSGLGARRIGERGVHDAASGDLAEDVALPWVDAVLEASGEAA